MSGTDQGAMINQDEKNQLEKTCEELERPVALALYQTKESKFGQKIESFVEEVCRCSKGKIRAGEGTPDRRLHEYPCFRVDGEEIGNLAYAAVPTGHQFAPFLGALKLAGGKRIPVTDPPHSQNLLPGEIQVLVSENCPRCPAVVEAAISLSDRDSEIFSCVMDVMQFPKLVQKYRIKSVPATILDRRLVLIGSVSAERLAALARIRGTNEFEMEVVQSIIDTGRIAEAADCLNQEAGRSVLVALLQHPEFSKRLSALVVLQKALEEKPDTVRILVPSLVDLLSHEDSRIRGDIADLLGKIGDPQVLPQLERLLGDPDPDVVEAAADAIAELRKPHVRGTP
jgi:hypothetical protein